MIVFPSSRHIGNESHLSVPCYPLKYSAGPSTVHEELCYPVGPVQVFQKYFNNCSFVLAMECQRSRFWVFFSGEKLGPQKYLSPDVFVTLLD